MQLMIGLLNGLCGVSNFLEEVNVPYFKNRLKVKSEAVFLLKHCLYFHNLESFKTRPIIHMKPHVTNLDHKKFSLLIEETIQRIEEVPIEEKKQVLEKITELKNNKHLIEEIYSDYQLKLKELSHLLDEYERTKQISRINLRKLQLWLKFSYTKLVKNFV